MMFCTWRLLCALGCSCKRGQDCRMFVCLINRWAWHLWILLDDFCWDSWCDDLVCIRGVISLFCYRCEWCSATCYVDSAAVRGFGFVAEQCRVLVGNGWVLELVLIIQLQRYSVRSGRLLLPSRDALGVGVRALWASSWLLLLIFSTTSCSINSEHDVYCSLRIDGGDSSGCLSTARLLINIFSLNNFNFV